MFKRKKDPDGLVDFGSYTYYGNEGTEAKKKKHSGCIVAVIALVLFAGIFVVWLLQKNESKNTADVNNTVDVNAAQSDLEVSSGLSRAIYTSSGQRIGLTDLHGGTVIDAQAASPVSIPVTLSSNSLQALDQIAYPEGAEIDPQSGQLVVFGKPAEAGASPSSSDFLVALQSVYNDEFPGVSIDPTQSTTVQTVRYIGPTEATHAGLVMFEADRLMKNLSLGQDNITGQAITSNVQGYANMFNLEFQLGDQTSQEQRRRFWFVVPDVEIEQNPLGDGMVITHLELAVKTEYLDANWNTLAVQPPDPAGKAFAGQLSTHFDDYAREFPVLEELRELAYWTALAQWVKQSNLPIQPGLWLAQVPQRIETPKTTPAITLTQTQTQGNIAQTLSLWGGVDLTINLGENNASSATKTILSQVLSRFVAPFSGPAAQVVAGISTNSAVEGYTTKIQLPLGNLEFIYQSDGVANPSLWDNWSLALPHMQAIQTGTQTQPIAYIYYDPNQAAPEALVSGGNSSTTGDPVYVDIKDGLHLEVKPDSLYLLQGTFTDGTNFSYLPDQFSSFNLTGDIVTQVRSSNDSTNYLRQGDQLVGIESPQDKLEFQYDQYGKLQSLKGDSAQYQFIVTNGLLIEIRDAQGQTVQSFEYKDKCLSKIMDAQGHTVQEMRYDSSNRVSAVLQGGQNMSGIALYDWQNPGAPRVYTGAALVPWWNGSDKNLEDLKTVLSIKEKSSIVDQIMFVRVVKDRVLVLFTDQTYSLPQSEIGNPAKLRAALSGITKQASGSKYVLISSGEAAGVGFSYLFPDAIPLSADGLNETQILGNLASLAVPRGMTPENSNIINGLPLPDQLEAIKIKLNDPSVWSGKFDLLEGTSKAAGFNPLPGKATSFQEALARSSTFIILEAHSDGTYIYLPDGSQFSLDMLTQSDLEKLGELKSIVIVFSCYTGKVAPTGNFSFAKKLLDTGPSMVVAPTGVLPVDKANEMVRDLLTDPTRNSNVLKAFYKAYIKAFPDGLISRSSGVNSVDTYLKLLIGELVPPHVEA